MKYITITLLSTLAIVIILFTTLNIINNNNKSIDYRLVIKESYVKVYNNSKYLGICKLDSLSGFIEKDNL